MGATTETVGGGKARPLADDWISQLHGLMTGGYKMPGTQGQQTPGDNMGRADPMKSTNGIMDLIGSYLSGSDQAANASATAFRQQTGEDTKDIQQKFALGGTGFGTPASAGVSNYLAKATPAFAIGQGAQQMDMLKNVMAMFTNFAQLGTPQAQTVQKPGLAADIMGGVGGLVGAAAPFFSPGGAFGKSIFKNAV